MMGRMAQAGMAGPSAGVSCCRAADGPRSPWAAPAAGPGPGGARSAASLRTGTGRDGPARLRPAGSHSAAEPAPPGGQRGAALARPDPGRHVAAAPPARERRGTERGSGHGADAHGAFPAGAMLSVPPIAPRLRQARLPAQSLCTAEQQGREDLSHFPPLPCALAYAGTGLTAARPLISSSCQLHKAHCGLLP